MAKYSGRFVSERASVRLIPWHQGWLLLFLWLAGALPELVVHIDTALNPETFWNSGLITGPLFALVPDLIVFAITCFIPKRGFNVTLTIAYSVIYYLLCASQIVYFNNFGTFYSAYSAVHGGAAFQFWDIILTRIAQNLHWILLSMLPMLFFCIFAWRLFTFRGTKKLWVGVIPAFAGVILQVVLILTLPLYEGTTQMSTYDLYHNTADSYYCINKLGVLTGFRVDVQRYMAGDEEPDGTINIQVTLPPFTMPTFPTTQPTLPNDGTDPTDPGFTEPTEPPIDTSPNILDIDFTSLIENATSKVIQQMHQYFQNRTPSKKNEYTGIFEGCNLIMITAEALSTAVITEERTPTLYKMMTEGIYLENNYVPNWGTSTTDGEYAHLTGTIPKSGVWSFSRSSKNAMPLTMSQQLIKQGYNAYAYHGHTYTYYDRNKYLTNLGFYYKGYGGDSFGKGNGLDIKKSWPESDIQVVDVTTDLFVSSEPFVTYYMSISGHGDYTWLGNYIASKNKQLVLDEPYSEGVQAYIATQLEFEYSMELLLQRLEEAGVLDNTVIVIVADHYPYGLSNEQYSELVGHELETNFEIYKNGCIIYKPGIEPTVVTSPTSHLDILPTLSNMFGLEFDSRLYMGRDVFSDATPLVMFRNRSWMTDLVAYNADKKEYTYFTDLEIPKEYLDYINAEVANRFTISELILDQNYWKILFGGS